VTKLGEFSPLGYFFKLDNALKITEVANIFSAVNFMNYFFFTNGLGYILGDFFQTHLVTLSTK
jgi:hypothetical protein